MIMFRPALVVNAVSEIMTPGTHNQLFIRYPNRATD